MSFFKSVAKAEPVEDGTVFKIDWKVRYSEMDQIQHVRNDRYLDYCEDTRYSALERNHFGKQISSDKFASLKVNSVYLDHVGIINVVVLQSKRF